MPDEERVEFVTDVSSLQEGTQEVQRWMAMMQEIEGFGERAVGLTGGQAEAMFSMMGDYVHPVMAETVARGDLPPEAALGGMFGVGQYEDAISRMKQIELERAAIAAGEITPTVERALQTRLHVREMEYLPGRGGAPYTLGGRYASEEQVQAAYEAERPLVAPQAIAILTGEERQSRRALEDLGPALKNFEAIGIAERFEAAEAGYTSVEEMTKAETRSRGVAQRYGLAEEWSPEIGRARGMQYEQQQAEDAERARAGVWGAMQGLPTTGAAFLNELIQGDLSGSLLTGAAFGQQGVGALGAAGEAGMLGGAGAGLAGAIGPAAIGVAAIAAGVAISEAVEKSIQRGFEAGAKQAGPAIELSIATGMEVGAAHQFTQLGRIYGFDPAAATSRFFLPEQQEAVFGAMGTPIVRDEEGNQDWLATMEGVHAEYSKIEDRSQQIAFLTQLFGSEWQGVMRTMEAWERTADVRKFQERMGLSAEEIQQMEDSQIRIRQAEEIESQLRAKTGGAGAAAAEARVEAARFWQPVGEAVKEPWEDVKYGLGHNAWLHALGPVGSGIQALTTLPYQYARLKQEWGELFEGRDDGGGAAAKPSLRPGQLSWAPVQQVNVIIEGTLKLDRDNVFHVIAQQQAANAYHAVTRGGG